VTAEKMSEGGLEQRRLAAIMFTDMVGFSAAAQRDEGVAVKLLEEHRNLLRPKFLEHNGHEIKTIGDGFLVEFASAVAAVKCAIEIQMALAKRNLSVPAGRELLVRIGIHLGDVLVREDDIVGDGVNIAARVEPLADPGGVAVTQQVFDQVYNKFTLPLIPIGKKELKNIKGALEVYRLALDSVPAETGAGDQRKASLPGQHRRKRQKSIAVLPFVNLNSELENEFLSDGISEDLLNALWGIDGLHVAARTSCFAFKGRSDDVRKIGEALGVDTVLEGSVRKVGNRLRVTAQLINVADGFRLWSQSFDRQMQDVFAIQDDITSAIVAALRLRLAGRAGAARLQTTNTEAYELYLKGRFFWNSRGVGLKKALHYFELALLEDPNYALALAGLADAYSLLHWYGYLPPSEVIPKASAAAKRALELDPQLAEAHTSLGFCLLHHDCDWAGARRGFHRAIELNARTVPAHYWLGYLCSCSGSHEVAIECCRKAVELEPFSPLARTFLGWMHYNAGEFVEAERQLRKVLEFDGNFVFGVWLLGKVLLAAEQRDLALAALTRAAELSRGAAWTQCILGHAQAKFGEPAAALSILSELQDVHKHPYVPAISLSLLYLGLGDLNSALSWLDKSCADHEAWAVTIKVDPIFADLRADARFTALLEQMGLQV
jgi:adenylate cyclase